MRRLISLFLIAPLLLASGCIRESNQTLTLRADGTAQVCQNVLFQRSMVEGWLQQRAGFDDEAHDDFGDDFEDDFEEDDGEEAAMPDEGAVVIEAEAIAEAPADAVAVEGAPERAADADAAAEAAAPVDLKDPEQLKAKILENLRETNPLIEQFGERAKIDIQLTDDDVRLVMTFDFESLEELLTNMRHLNMDPGGSSRVMIDKSENGNLAFRMPGNPDVPAELRSQMVQHLKQQVKAAGFKGSLRFEMPGKVISSSLPVVDGNAASLVIDASDDATLESLARIITEGISVESEWGELKLAKLPLDSKDFVPEEPMHVAEERPGHELPLSETMPGYVAEATSVTTVDVVHLPVEDGVPASMHTAHETPGCTVQAKLFAPRGRHMLSLGEPTIKNAVDDQERTVEPLETGRMRHVRYSSNDDEQLSAQFELQLQLPQPDAMALELVEGEIDAVTFGDWKVQDLTGDSLKAKAETSLDAILPGAKALLVSAKDTTEENDEGRKGRFRLKLTGPSEIRYCDFKVKVEGTEHVHAYTGRDDHQTVNEQCERKVEVNYNVWRFDDEGAKANAAVTLQIRFPADLRRERVPFVLEAMDF